MGESLIKARVYLMHRKKVAFDTPTNADILMDQLCDELEATETKLRELVKGLRTFADDEDGYMAEVLTMYADQLEAILNKEN